jgi:ankyrin repeat protein
VTALIFAAMEGKTEAARVLLENGADPTVHTNEGLTALQAAKLKEHEDIVNLLKLAGAEE